ncbi:MAG: heme-binding protein [Gammaproteobacteria bacterium]|nr:heme-binding protein [Gammaproteobacteria bacterium]
MTELTLQQANTLIDEVLNAAHDKDMPPVAVAVLDSGAHLKAFQREDGVSFLRVQIAQAKAWGALAMACNTDHLAERYNQDALQQGFINALNGVTDGKIIPLPGGVLLRNDNEEIIGAVGVAGGASNDDAACIATALESLGPGLSGS